LSDRNLKLEFSEDIYDLLLKLSKEEYGANATILNRIIAKNIEPCISDTLMKCGEGLTITISVDNNSFICKKS
jgi:ATP-dependent Clp protease ATP-binding subunit ClpA